MSLIAFFAAGFFWPALPWGLVVAFIMGCIYMYGDVPRRLQISDWWTFRSKSSAVQIATIHIAGQTIGHTLAMLLGNWVETIV